jgi:HK97 family phage major capsid protein/HK97 family phage prohead protease
MSDTPKPEDRSAEGTVAVEGNELVGTIPYNRIGLAGPRRQKEVISPGAFAATDLHRMVAIVGHDESSQVPIGRYSATLTAEDREDGKAFEWRVPLPDSPLGQNVREAVKRGDLSGTSWRMVVPRDGERMVEGVRHVDRVAELHHVCVTHLPAYPDASVELREENAPAEDETAEGETQTTQTTPTVESANPEEGTQMPNRENGGGLAVEDRVETGDATTPEMRVSDAIRAVPQGEVRNLTLASADPVEPEDLSTFVFDLLRPASVLLRSGVPVIPTNRKEWSAPTITGDIDADWVGEAELIPESDPVLGELKATPRKVAQRVIASSESLDDSNPQLQAILQQNLATALALKIDREGIVGNSSKGFKGLATMSGTQSLNGAEAKLQTYDALVAAVALLAEAQIPGDYAILMHPRHAATLDRLRVVTAVAGESGPELVMGNAPLPRPEGLPPIYVTPNVGFTAGASGKVDRAPIIVYSPSQLAMIRRKETEMVVDRSAEFDTDEVSIRAIARCCLTTAYPESVVVIKDVAAPAITL